MCILKWDLNIPIFNNKLPVLLLVLKIVRIELKIFYSFHFKCICK